jgi:hypothetical protein
MKCCIKCASMYMVIRNEVKVMLFRLSVPRSFDQDCTVGKGRSILFWPCFVSLCDITNFVRNL